MTSVLGVDACPGGWVGVELRDGRFASAHVGTRLNELIGKVPDAVIIGVDMPLGLLDSGELIVSSSESSASGLPASS
jgi:predicted RNase H-like nuclease